MTAACCDHHDHDGRDVTGGQDEHGEDGGERPWWRDRALLLPLLSGVLLVAGLTWTGSDPIALALSWAALLVGASRFAPGAVRRLARGRLGIALLMTISAVGAVLLGHVEEAAALAFLYSLAEALEDRAMDRARAGLRALLTLLPDEATVMVEGRPRMVPARDLQVGQVVLVRPGERVPTDGVVRDGTGGVDTSAVTGESMPLEVATGDVVPAGAISLSTALHVEATAAGTDNSLTTIVSLVERAQREKGERARLADRIARPLVPGVLALAAAVALLGSLLGDPGLWITRALVVLVAASPCALAIAVPVTVVSAIGAATRFGMVVKSGAAFERLGSIGHVAFDKTGTLTRNQPEVTDATAAPGWDEPTVVGYAAALESHSLHPLAGAIVRAAAGVPVVATGVTEQPGAGLTGTVGGVAVAVGSPRSVDPEALRHAADRFEESGATVVVVQHDGAAVGLLAIRDELRPEAPEAVVLLGQMGIGVTMLTGDNRTTAAALAAAAGIEDVHAELRPEDKSRLVERLSAAHPTAMIGDGINDAPALAAADVGIAMGATGSDVAIASADIAFTGHDLRLIPQGFRHARRGRRIMSQNIALSLLIVTVLVPLALTGVLGLAAVVLTHEVAEVVVILNGLRAARRR